MRGAIAFAQTDPASIDVPVYAKILLATRGKTMDERLQFAEATRASDRVQRMFTPKALVSAATTDDSNYGSILGDRDVASTAFLTSLRSRSAFFRMLADGALQKTPLRTHLAIVSSNATAWITGEGKARPISRFSLTNPTLQPYMAAAIIVVTDDVARSLDPAASALITNELRGAVADVVDEKFWDLIIDTSTASSASAGTTAENMRDDLRTLLDEVNLTGAGALYWAMAPDVGNRAALVDDGRGGMSPVGGMLLNIPALVSNTIPAGTLRLIDASAIAASAEAILLDASNEADIEMSDAPAHNSDVPTAAQLVSLFQTNSTALRARVRFAAERTKVSAVAEITNIAWA
jgi:hypothetical protein